MMNYTWIFVGLLLVNVYGEVEQCALLTKPLILKDDPNVCHPSGPTLGNAMGKFATVDFSSADNKVLNTFLQKFEVIQAAIIIENSNLDTINFGKIGEWNGGRVPENEIFINIRNNPKLTKFEWDSTVKDISINAGAVPVNVFVYNNPLLNAETLTMIKDVATSNKKIKGYIQSEPGECFFEDPLDSKKYLSPIPEILENCRIIKGDFVLDGGKLKEMLKLVDGGCLRLTGVNMAGVIVEASPGTGKDTCNDGTTKSEVTRNLNLCGQELKKLVDYFPVSSAVKIEMDPGTCTIECQNAADVVDKYNYCKTITKGASITDWFTNEDLKEKVNHLVSAEELTISGGSMTKISLPKLTEAKGLIIKNNAELTDLDLPALNTVTTLVIEGSPKLTLATINKVLSEIEPTTSTVECRLTESDVIKDIKDLRLCSTIIGPLTLEGLKNFDKAKFQVKKIEGCVKIQNTQLRSLSFLNIDISGCAGQHLVTGDNRQLCRVGHFDANKTIPVTFEGKFMRDCGKICSSLEDGDCEVLHGDLVFKPAMEKKLKKLKIIVGKLNIDKSSAESLDFPSLKEIQAPTAPALQITNNPALKSLTMKKLQNITVADGTKPAIKITGNKQLNQETLKQFLNPEYYKHCIEKTDKCEYVNSVEIEDSPNWWIKWAIIYGCAFSLLFLVGAIAIYCVVKMNREAARIEREIEEEEAEEKAEKAEEEKEEKEEKERLEKEEKEAKEKERKRKIDDGTRTAKEPKKVYEIPAGMRTEKEWLSRDDSTSDVIYRIDDKKVNTPGYIPDEQKKQHEWAARVLNKSPEQVKAEFRRLANFKSEKMTIEAFMANPTKNRYPNVPCQDDHRVELIHPKWPGVKMTCNYIHANLVGWNKWSDRHPYILTQAPMKNTLFDFWFMIVQEVIKHMVMLGETEECGKEMCCQYWPVKVGETMTLKQDGIEIVITHRAIESNRLSKQEPGIRQTQLHVKCSNGTQIPFTHYQVNWTEGGVPPSPKTVIHLFSHLQWKRAPVVIHCNDGVGRSGTVAAIGYTLAMIRDGYHYTEMADVTTQIRKTRAMAIKDEMQYLYVHRVVLMYLFERHARQFGMLLEKDGNKQKYKAWIGAYDREFEEFKKRVASQKRKK